MLSLLVPDRLSAADAALRRLSMKELFMLPEWLRSRILNHTNSIDMTFSIVPPRLISYRRCQHSAAQRPARLPGISAASGYNFPPATWHNLKSRELSINTSWAMVPIPLSGSPHLTRTRQVTPKIFPVSLTWFQATKFCELFSAVESEKEAGRRCRLPRKAEWEFACRRFNNRLRRQQLCGLHHSHRMVRQQQ